MILNPNNINPAHHTIPVIKKKEKAVNYLFFESK